MKRRMLYVIFMLQAFIFNLSNVITPRFLNELELPKYMFGYYSAIWSLGMLISSPLWGRIATRYGKKRFVLLGATIYGLSQLGFYFIKNIYILGLLRFTSGIGVGAIVTLLLSYLVLDTDSKERANAISKRMAFITVGTTVSYVVSGYIGLNLTEDLFLYQSVLSIGFIILIVLFVRRDTERACAFPNQHHTIKDSVRFLKKMDKTVLVFLLSITLSSMCFVNVDKFLDLYIVDQGYQVSVIGNVKMVFGIVLVITNLVFIPSLKKYIGNAFILQTISVMMGIIVLVTFMEDDLLVMLYSVFLGFIVLKGIYICSEQLYLSKVVSKDQLSIFFGIRQSFTCLGMILGPVIGGHIYAQNPINLFYFNVVCLLFSSLIISYMKFVPEKSKELAFSK